MENIGGEGYHCDISLLHSQHRQDATKNFSVSHLLELQGAGNLYHHHHAHHTLLADHHRLGGDIKIPEGGTGASAVNTGKSDDAFVYSSVYINTRFLRKVGKNRLPAFVFLVFPFFLPLPTLIVLGFGFFDPLFISIYTKSGEFPNITITKLIRYIPRSCHYKSFSDLYYSTVQYMNSEVFVDQ